MSSVVELYKVTAAYSGLNENELRYVSRVEQQAGILPIHKRGGGTPPQITAEHIAMFLFGIAGTGTARQAATAAKVFASLTRVKDGVKAPQIVKRGGKEYFKKLPNSYFRTLLDDIVQFGNEAMANGEALPDGPKRLIFAHDPDFPYAEIDWTAPKEPWVYHPPIGTGVYVSKIGGFKHAALFDGGIFNIFPVLLAPSDKRKDAE